MLGEKMRLVVTNYFRLGVGGTSWNRNETLASRPFRGNAWPNITDSFFGIRVLLAVR